MTQYERDDEYTLADQVRRFGDPVNNPYIKEHFAIAIVESNQADDHIETLIRYCRLQMLISLCICFLLLI